MISTFSEFLNIQEQRVLSEVHFFAEEFANFIIPILEAKTKVLDEEDIARLNRNAQIIRYNSMLDNGEEIPEEENSDQIRSQYSQAYSDLINTITPIIQGHLRKKHKGNRELVDELTSSLFLRVIEYLQEPKDGKWRSLPDNFAGWVANSSKREILRYNQSQGSSAPGSGIKINSDNVRSNPEMKYVDQKVCPLCKSRGTFEGSTCPACEGEGYVEKNIKLCPTCSGEDSNCSTCKGKGVIEGRKRDYNKSAVKAAKRVVQGSSQAGDDEKSGDVMSNASGRSITPDAAQSKIEDLQKIHSALKALAESDTRPDPRYGGFTKSQLIALATSWKYGIEEIGNPLMSQGNLSPADEVRSRKKAMEQGVEMNQPKTPAEKWLIEILSSRPKIASTTDDSILIADRLQWHIQLLTGNSVEIKPATVRGWIKKGRDWIGDYLQMAA